MKKTVLLIVCIIGFSALAWAQEYEMNVHVRIKSDLNNVKCESHFKVSFLTAQGHRFDWFQELDMDESQWVEFDHSFHCSLEDRVTSVYVWSKREISNCDTEDQGDEEFTFPISKYPCSTSQYANQFRGYDGASTIDITVRPLSSEWAFATEDYLAPSKDSYISYTVIAEYEDGGMETIMGVSGHKSFLNSDEYHRDCRIVGGNRRVERLWFFMRVGGIFGTTKTQIYTIDPEKRESFDLRISQYNSNIFTDYPVGWDSYVRIRYNVFHTPVKYSPAPEDGIDQSLPTDNAITLQTDENYTYRWQYNLNGEGWKNMPSAYLNAKAITLTGRALLASLGKNLDSYLFKNIQIRPIYTCAESNNRTAEILTLPILPSAPNIIDMTHDQETCYGSRDAKLKLTFSRPLYTFTQNGNVYKEEITVTLNNKAREETSTSFDAGNVLTVYNLAPGDYKANLITKFAPTLAGFTGGTGHTRSDFIPATTAIQLTAVGADVHCKDGEDGRIIVTATGGTSPYTAITQVKGVDTSISLSSTAGNTFTGLPVGTYTVRLTDKNACVPKNAGGANTPPPVITLLEPAKPVQVSAVDNVEPLGFGLTNGYVTVRAADGTTPYTFAWTDQTNAPRTANPSETEGASMKSTLPNLGKGVYRVRAQDANYNLVNPRNETNIRGCYDTLTFVVTEPPLLEVVMDQYHFVTCHDYTDGELVAHAKGGRPYAAGLPYSPYQYEWFLVNDDGLATFGTYDSIAIDRHSAIYRVKVTDRNGIIAWSPDYTLVQPDLLKIGFNTPTLLCNGDTNGTSVALPQGGTKPYQYAWSTDATTPDIEGLSDGWYSVVVKDIRGCTTFNQTEVKVPLGLEAEAVITPPLCNGYSDGAVALAVAGGRLPYTYAWDHGANTPAINELGAGTYNVLVTDANGCFIKREYILVDPALFAVNLGPDRVLCKDQILPLDVTLADDPGTIYSWFKDGAPFAATAATTLSETGAYRVEVRDSDGCFNSDEITIARDETVINASIVVATRVPVGGRVRIANISNPASDRVQWIIPPAATLHEETQGYLDVSFPAKGEYSVGLTGFKNACETTTYTTVRVVGSNELADYQPPVESYIRQFSVTPNPNSGQFTASVELREAGDFSLVLFNGQGTIVTRKDITRQAVTSVEFDVSSVTGQGIYMLQLQTREGYATFKVSVIK